MTFRLGDLTLGTTDAAQELTLPDVVGTTLPATGSALSDALYQPTGATSLERLVNVAVLLETLDSDADASNGIDIPAEVESRLSAASLKLDMRYYEFAQGGNLRDGLGLPGLLRATAADSLLSARPVANPGLALQRIYDLQAAPFTAQFSSLRQDDDDADGIVDRVRSLTWLANGKIGVDDYDNNADGTVDTRYTYTYGNNAEQLGYTRDDGVDGVIEFERRITYDAFGVTTEFLQTTGTGAVNRRNTSTYDAAGKLTRLETETAAGVRVEHWTVDAAGLRSLFEFDREGDGQIDERAQLYYPQGETRSDRWTRQERDVNLDGTVDVVIERAFDAAGRKTMQWNDQDNDGLPEYEERSTFDAQGRIVTYMRDNDGGGFDYAYRWIYAADGLTATRETDNDGDGVYEQVRNRFFDADGNLLRDEYDNDGDGQVDAVNRYTYNAAGQLIEQANDQDADGQVDRRYTYERNAAGDLVRQTFDRFDDGTLDTISEYSGFVDASVVSFL